MDLKPNEKRVGEPMKDDPISMAYYAGLCTSCLVNPHQPGSPKCATCWPMRAPRPTVIPRLWVTAEQRALCRQVAADRQASHEQAGDPDHQIATDRNGADGHYIGLLGEFAFYNTFGGPLPDLKFRHGGDRQDSWLLVRGVKWRVDVKASGYTGKDPYLRVPQSKADPNTIYVAGAYDRSTDDVALVCWEMGKVLMKGRVRKFGSYKELNYTMLYRDCRSIEELKQRAGVK